MHLLLQALNANIDRSYIGRIERGEENITVEMLCKIAAYIKIDPRELLPEYLPEN